MRIARDQDLRFVQAQARREEFARALRVGRLAVEHAVGIEQRRPRHGNQRPQPDKIRIYRIEDVGARNRMLSCSLQPADANQDIKPDLLEERVPSSAAMMLAPIPL